MFVETRLPDAGAGVLVTVMTVGGTFTEMLGPTDEVEIAAPLAISVVTGLAGMVTLLVEGPTVSKPVPELKVTGGVISSVEVPSMSMPVDWLKAGAGILIL